MFYENLTELFESRKGTVKWSFLLTGLGSGLTSSHLKREVPVGMMSSKKMVY